MERVYGLISDDILPQIDEAAKQEGVSRAKWIGLAISSYLHRNGDELHRIDDNGDEKGDETIINLQKERDEFIVKAEKNIITLDEQARSITHLEDIVRRQDDEIFHLRDMSKLLTAKVLPALPIIQDAPQPKKPRWKFW